MILIVLGVLILIAPLLLEKMLSLERIPWIMLYVYRTDGFIFATSPILIIVGIVSLFLGLLSLSPRLQQIIKDHKS